MATSEKLASRPPSLSISLNPLEPPPLNPPIFYAHISHTCAYVVCNSEVFTYLQNGLVSLVRTSKIIEI